MNLPEMYLPEIRSFDQIITRARDKVARTRKVRAALIAPTDPAMLEACDRAAAKGLIEPVVIGDAAAWQATYTDSKLTFKPTAVLDIPDPVKALLTASEMAVRAEIDLLIKGRIVTADMLSVLFRKDTQFATKGKMISHVAVLKPERYRKLLMLTDSGVVVQPDLQTKLALIGNLASVAKGIGIPSPRVAVLAAVEVVYPQMVVTMEAAVISKMAERGQIKDVIVDGPLSFDCAVDMFAAHSKGVKVSPVAGQADALLAPNIETANGIYKGMALYGSCEMGGLIVGGRIPIALGSRSDSVASKFNSIILGVLMAP